MITLGLYPLYWHFKALYELYAEHRQGEFPIILYILYYVPVVSFIVGILYMSTFVDKLNAVRHAKGLPPAGISLGSFLAWYILGSFIIIGPFIAYYKLQNAINDVWESAASEKRQESSPPVAQPPPDPVQV